MPWRAIYRELRRMELRGDVRRGYFVRGLAGAQFALPAAVEQLRASATASNDDHELVVIAASDPANIWTFPVAAEPGASPDAFARLRGARALLVTRAGRVLATADARDRAATSTLAPAFIAAGLRLTTAGLRFYASFDR